MKHKGSFHWGNRKGNRRSHSEGNIRTGIKRRICIFPVLLILFVLLLDFPVWADGREDGESRSRLPGSGLAEKAYSYDGGKTWTADPFFTVTENGAYEVQVRDKLGNMASGSFEVHKIDRKAPEAEAVVLPREFVRDKAVIVVSASDEGAGLAGRPYSYDGGSTWTADSMHEVQRNGEYQVAVRDLAGNVTGLTVPVKNIDREPPEITFTMDPDPWYQGNAVLTIHARDEGAGLDVKAFSFDEGRNYQAAGTWVVQEPGEIKVLVRDALGNCGYGYYRAVRREREVTDGGESADVQEDNKESGMEETGLSPVPDRKEGAYQVQKRLAGPKMGRIKHLPSAKVK